jgi:hypothetical protein
VGETAKLSETYQAELKRLQDELSGKIETTSLHASPEWQRLSNTVESLRVKDAFKSLNDNQLLAMAIEMKGDTPDNDPGSIPPGSGGSAASVSTPEEPQGFTDEIKWALEHNMNYSKEKIAEMEKAQIASKKESR